MPSFFGRGARGRGTTISLPASGTALDNDTALEILTNWLSRVFDSIKKKKQATDVHPFTIPPEEMQVLYFIKSNKDALKAVAQDRKNAVRLRLFRTRFEKYKDEIEQKKNDLAALGIVDPRLEAHVVAVTAIDFSASNSLDNLIESLVAVMTDDYLAYLNTAAAPAPLSVAGRFTVHDAVGPARAPGPVPTPYNGMDTRLQKLTAQLKTWNEIDAAIAFRAAGTPSVSDVDPVNSNFHDELVADLMKLSALAQLADFNRQGAYTEPGADQMTSPAAVVNIWDVQEDFISTDFQATKVVNGVDLTVKPKTGSSVRQPVGKIIGENVLVVNPRAVRTAALKAVATDPSGTRRATSAGEVGFDAVETAMPAIVSGLKLMRRKLITTKYDVRYVYVDLVQEANPTAKIHPVTADHARMLIDLGIQALAAGMIPRFNAAELHCINSHAGAHPKQAQFMAIYNSIPDGEKDPATLKAAHKLFSDTFLTGKHLEVAQSRRR